MTLNDMVNEAINTARDIQTIEAVPCKKCKSKPHIAETMFRDRYKVTCCGCETETEWYRKIDEAVIKWNKEQII